MLTGHRQITSSSSTGDTTDLGWVRPGDPRADLLLAISQQGVALPVLLNGLSRYREGGGLAGLLAPAPPALVASVSPVARARAGQYAAVPTFVAHGTEDEVAPFAAAARFVDAVRARAPRVPCELLSLPGARHLFDLGLEEGSPEWDRVVAPGYDFLVKFSRSAQ